MPLSGAAQERQGHIQRIAGGLRLGWSMLPEGWEVLEACISAILQGPVNVSKSLQNRELQPQE